MSATLSNDLKKTIGADRLLGRGSQMLGLACVAYARGHRAGSGDWHVLSRNIVVAAEEILSGLEQKPNPELLEAVIQAALSLEPATAPPSWAAPLVDNPYRIDRIGAAMDMGEVISTIPSIGSTAVTDRERGLAALAVGFCRKIDSLQALTRSFPATDRRTTERLASLAQVVVRRGVPSRIRAEIRRLLEQDTADG
ncbi:MAG: hypothetical protein QNJ97_21070 [Myxococcota bacterium]|nr:hypothetical protein [Myxococcota bacterium]